MHFFQSCLLGGKNCFLNVSKCFNLFRQLVAFEKECKIAYGDDHITIDVAKLQLSKLTAMWLIGIHTIEILQYLCLILYIRTEYP